MILGVFREADAMDNDLDTGTDDLVAHRDGGVAIIRFNRPDRRNALSNAMYEGFSKVLPVIAADPTVQVVMLTGEGGAFCAGGDVKGFAAEHRAVADGGTPASPETKTQRLRAIHQAIPLALTRLSKPVVAAIPGPAAGAGLSIALAADIRLAADSAILVTAFSTIGASGDFGGSWFLTQLVGPSVAKELYFLSPRLTASDAHRLGIVNHVLPDDGFEAAALAWCHRLAERAPIAMGLIKENVNRAVTCDLITALDAEAANMVRSMQTNDHIEASAAFVEKRAPTFTGT